MRGFGCSIAIHSQLPHPFGDFFADQRMDLLSVVQHVVAGNARNPITLAVQENIASAIPRPPRFNDVIRSVNFENQLELDAAEVRGVGRYRIFPAKLLAVDLAVANPLPNRACELIGSRALQPGEFKSFR